MWARREAVLSVVLAVGACIHDKAMPVMLMTAEDVDVWLNGTLEEALKLQKPQPDDSLVITPYDEKKAA